MGDYVVMTRGTSVRLLVRRNIGQPAYRRQRQRVRPFAGARSLGRWRLPSPVDTRGGQGSVELRDRWPASVMYAVASVGLRGVGCRGYAGWPMFLTLPGAHSRGYERDCGSSGVGPAVAVGRAVHGRGELRVADGDGDVGVGRRGGLHPGLGVRRRQPWPRTWPPSTR